MSKDLGGAIDGGQSGNVVESSIFMQLAGRRSAQEAGVVCLGHGDEWSKSQGCETERELEWWKGKLKKKKKKAKSIQRRVEGKEW